MTDLLLADTRQVSKKTMFLMSTETIRFIRDGEKGGGGMEVGEERGRLYLSLRCHHQNGSCIKVGSDESHFNVSLIVRDRVMAVLFALCSLCGARWRKI